MGCEKTSFMFTLDAVSLLVSNGLVLTQKDLVTLIVMAKIGKNQNIVQLAWCLMYYNSSWLDSHSLTNICSIYSKFQLDEKKEKNHLAKNENNTIAKQVGAFMR